MSNFEIGTPLNFWKIPNFFQKDTLPYPQEKTAKFQENPPGSSLNLEDCLKKAQKFSPLNQNLTLKMKAKVNKSYTFLNQEKIIFNAVQKYFSPTWFKNGQKFQNFKIGPLPQF